MAADYDAQGTFEIVNALGLHARAAAQFVSLAAKFESEIYVEKDGYEVNGKSIMGVMTLAAPQGSTLIVKAIGGDAENAVEQLGELIKNKFGED
jgi:phosphocarrier protein HPr